MSKSKVFMSHATPEDNYFAGWLAAKLTLAGYNVWCDLIHRKATASIADEDLTRYREVVVKVLQRPFGVNLSFD